MQTFTCQACKETKPADQFVKGAKNPSKCLECRKKDMMQRKIKQTDQPSPFRKTITFSPLSAAMIAAMQQGETPSRSVEKIFLLAYERMDPQTKQIVSFYQKQLLAKSPSADE